MGVTTGYSLESGNGFKQIASRNLKGAEEKFTVFEHLKTGATLVHVQNDDINTMFAFTFKTPPENDKGYAHVIEHAFFSGAKKYGMKSILNQLNQKSFATESSAVTFNDHTTFFASSTNKKAFGNLMTVYVDSLVDPGFLETPEILMREGMRYDIASPEAPIVPNGIVFNEERGYYGSRNLRTYDAIAGSLFPDNSYRFRAIGKPASMLDLNDREFIDFYKRYYHPSNMLVYLYGKMDITETLGWLNDNYFKRYEKKGIDSTLKLQPPFSKKRRVVASYPLKTGGNAGITRNMSLNFVVGSSSDKDTVIGTALLAVYLDAPDSALKEAFYKAGISGEVSVGFERDLLQPVFTVFLNNTSLPQDQAERFEETVMGQMKILAKTGVNLRRMENILSASKRSQKVDKLSAERSLMYLHTIRSSWSHGNDPLLNISFDDSMAMIRDRMDKGYFERLAKDHLLKNSHSSLVIMEPVKDLVETETTMLKNKLSAYKQSLSKQEVNALVEKSKKFHQWQSSPESTEAIDKALALSMEDVELTVEKPPVVKRKTAGATLIHTPVNTSGMGYVNIYFDTTRVPLEKLPYLMFLAEILNDYDPTNNLNAYGNVDFSIKTYTKHGERTEYMPRLKVSMMALSNDLPRVMASVTNIIDNIGIRFDVERLNHIVERLASGYGYSFVENIESTTGKVRSYLTQQGQYNELNGYSKYEFYEQVKQLLKNAPRTVIKNLTEVARLAFPRQNMMVGVTLGNDEYAKNNIESAISQFVNRRKNSDAPVQRYHFPKVMGNETIPIMSQVHYVALGSNLSGKGYRSNDGKDAVAAFILNQYVNDQVRMKDGAYGGGVKIDFPNLLVAAWQCPKIETVFHTAKMLSEAVKHFDVPDREMDSIRLAVLKNIHKPQSVWDKGNQNEFNAITQDSYENMEQRIKDVITTTPAEIRAYAPMMEELSKESRYCIFGNSRGMEAFKKKNRGAL
jgi:hypothetical protein